MHCSVPVLWSDGKIRLALVRVNSKSNRSSLARSAMRYAWHSARVDSGIVPLKAIFEEFFK